MCLPVCLLAVQEVVAVATVVLPQCMHVAARIVM